MGAEGKVYLRTDQDSLHAEFEDQQFKTFNLRDENDFMSIIELEKLQQEIVKGAKKDLCMGFVYGFGIVLLSYLIFGRDRRTRE